MRNVTVSILTIAGFAVGYYTEGHSGMNLFTSVFSGGALFYFLSSSLFEKEYGYWIGALIGLLITTSVNWLAGSSFDISSSFPAMAFCSFTSDGFRYLWKYDLIGTFIGGIIGFVGGLSESDLFGKVFLPAGLLNASLSAIRISIIGTSLASLFFRSVGRQFIARGSQTE